MINNGREPRGSDLGSPLPGSSGAGHAGLVLHLTADLRERVIRAAADESHGADHDDQDYRQHNRVLGDVLTAFISPKLIDRFIHCLPPIDDTPQGFKPLLGTVIRRRVPARVS